LKDLLNTLEHICFSAQTLYTFCLSLDESLYLPPPHKKFQILSRKEPLKAPHQLAKPTAHVPQGGECFPFIAYSAKLEYLQKEEMLKRECEN